MPLGKIALNVRIDQETRDKLEQYAAAATVSTNWLLVRAIDEFLEKLPPVEEVQLTFTRITEKKENP